MAQFAATSQLLAQVLAPLHFRPQPLVQPVTLQTGVVAQVSPQLFPGQSMVQEAAPLQTEAQLPPPQVKVQVAPPEQESAQLPPGQEKEQVPEVQAKLQLAPSPPHTRSQLPAAQAHEEPTHVPLLPPQPATTRPAEKSARINVNLCIAASMGLP